jgi:5-methylcytosine-specific restriction endonuclease McrA
MSAIRAHQMGRRSDNIPLDDLVRIIEKQGYRCAYCPRLIIHKFHLDHRLPLALGGHHIAGNVQFTCPHCNISKKDRLGPQTMSWTDYVRLPVSNYDPGEAQPGTW